MSLRPDEYWKWFPQQYRRLVRKRTAKEWKRFNIEARQVARAVVIVNQAPALIHRGKAAR